MLNSAGETVCAYCGAAHYFPALGDGTAGHPWTIGTAEEWDHLAEIVQEGLDTTGKHFLLTGGISVTTMIGTAEHPFCGHFDGGGNTLTVNLTASADGKGPFAFVSGAEFERVRVGGTIATDVIDTGGLVGLNAGGCVITDCVSSVEISVPNSRNGHAGFVGESSTGVKAMICGSLFNGSITGAPRYSSGFAGAGDGEIADCVYDASMGPGAANTTFLRHITPAPNCYYTNLDNISRIKGLKACAVTAAADSGVALDFGKPAAVYPTSGITAYAKGLVYNGVFYAGPGQSVTLGLSCAAPAGFAAEYTASAGELTCADGVWTLTLPDGDVEIGVEFVPVFGPATFTLPGNLTRIEERAFEGAAYIAVVDAHNCAFIGANAFGGCAALTQIRLSQNCTIDDTAFTGCGTVTVFAPAGGTTEAWCAGREGIVFAPEPLD